MIRAVITKEEYDAAPRHEEGFARAWAKCRVCGAPTEILTWWQNGEPMPMGHGRKPGCVHPKCGEKCPDAIIRMLRHDEVKS